MGASVWAAGYVGWLPKLGLMKPVDQPTRAQIAGPIATHVLFEIAVAGVYRLLSRC